MLAIVMVCMLLIMQMGALPARAFTGTTNLMGYIENIDIGNLTLVVDGENIEVTPNISVETFSGGNKTVFDLRVNQFVNIRVISYGKNWKASKIKLINKKYVKSITSYISHFEKNILTLGNGQKFVVPDKPKIIGFDTFERDMMIRIDGYVSSGKLNIWRFVAPYNERDEDYSFCGELTDFQVDKLIIDSQVIIHFEEVTMWDEAGWRVPDISPKLGMILRITCDVQSNFLFAKKFELFESIQLKLKDNSDIAIINKQKVTLVHPITNIDDFTLVPIKSIFKICGLDLFVDKKNNQLSTIINGINVSYNMATGELFEENNSIKILEEHGFTKIDDEYMVPLRAFAFLFCRNDYIRYPLLRNKDEVVFFRY